MVATFPHRVKKWSLWDPIVQLDWHKGVFVIEVPPFATPGAAFHASASFLWASHLTGDPNDNHDSIYANGAPIASRGANVGAFGLLPHANVGPVFYLIPSPNLWIPILLANCSSECIFAVSSVRGPDGAIACSCLPYAGLNLACADPANLPTSGVVTRGTVYLGFTWGDFFYGLALMAIKDVLDFALDKLTGPLTDKIQKKLMDSLKRSSILKTTLRPALNKIIGKLFLQGRGFSYAQKGLQGFQSVADDYIKAALDHALGIPTDAATGAVIPSAESITNLIAGGDETF